MFLPRLLPHPDAVGAGVAGGGAGRHGALASRVVGYCAGVGQVGGRRLGEYVSLSLQFRWSSLLTGG